MLNFKLTEFENHSDNSSGVNYLKFKQNEIIFHIVKFITNIPAELDTNIDNYITVWTDETGRPIGTCYTSRKGVLIKVKDFIATPSNLFPIITDRHLKMLIHFLSKEESIQILNINEFNKECDTKKDTKGTRRHYKTLEELLKFEIAYKETSKGKDELIRDANVFNYQESLATITFRPLILAKATSFRVSNKINNTSSQIQLAHKDVSASFKKAEIEINNSLINTESAGIMYYHPNLLKIKNNSRTILGTLSIAFNLYYLASVNSNKNKESLVTYNVSTVLKWIGIYETMFFNFLNKDKSRGVSYYKKKLDYLFEELETINIYAKISNYNSNAKTFYNKTQVEFDLSHLKEFCNSKKT